MASDNIGGIKLIEFPGFESSIVNAREGTSTLEQDYADKLEEFRDKAEIISSNNGAVAGGIGWMVFRDVPIDDLYVESVDTTRDVCVYITPRQNGKPHIRTIARDSYRIAEGIEYVVTDVTVDEDDDAQYHVGPYSELQESVEKKWALFSPTFYVVDGELKLRGQCVRQFIASMISLTGTDGEDFIPFGVYSNIMDRFQALLVARKILDDVADCIPLYTS